MNRRLYADAMRISRDTRAPVRYEIEIMPSGVTKYTLLDAEPDRPADPLAAARARGQALVATILDDDDMLNADSFGDKLGVTRATVNTWRRENKVLGLAGAKRGFRFPAWQVTEDGKPIGALPALFDRLGGNPWTVYRFLVQHHPELSGLTGREALRRGRIADVLDAAENVLRAAS